MDLAERDLMPSHGWHNFAPSCLKSCKSRQFFTKSWERWSLVKFSWESHRLEGAFACLNQFRMKVNHGVTPPSEQHHDPICEWWLHEIPPNSTVVLLDRQTFTSSPVNAAKSENLLPWYVGQKYPTASRRKQRSNSDFCNGFDLCTRININGWVYYIISSIYL